MNLLLALLENFNQLLAAGIAIMAFALLLYALAFNLRDRVARTFDMIMICVVIVFVGDALSSVTTSPVLLDVLLRLQWVGIVFLPPAYLHFSIAILATTGRGSRRRTRWLVRLMYLLSLLFLLTLPFDGLVGPLLLQGLPAPHLQRTTLTWIFSIYYLLSMVFSWLNFWHASQRVFTSTGKRRMNYLLLGALAPALGSFPYLLFGSGFAVEHQLIFWLLAVTSNLFVGSLLILMAYAVAFYGVTWPDRVVKLRLAKWLLRGPFAAVIVLGATTLVRRVGEKYGVAYTVLVPISMAGTLLIVEYVITLAGPYLQQYLFSNHDRATIDLLRTVQDRLVTSGDLRQFLEAILAAACDRLQVRNAFVAALDGTELEMLVNIPGSISEFPQDTQDILATVRQNDQDIPMLVWGAYWLIPLYTLEDEVDDEPALLGLFGVQRPNLDEKLEEDQQNALLFLAHRAALALEDRQIQQLVFSSLQTLAPQVDTIQKLRAASRFDSAGLLLDDENLIWENGELLKWVKDALTHYWGGPYLTESPLLKLQVVRQNLSQHDDNPANALRAVLRLGIDKVRPEGERRFTGEWILYNILEMKFMEGRKVRDIAARLAVSEADLYRKQRVAIEAVAQAIVDMEKDAWNENSQSMNDRKGA